MLEKGEYPRWSTWTNCQKSYNLSSFRPLKVVSIITVTEMRRCDFLSDILKCFSFASRIVQNTSYICSRMKAMKEERWRLLMTMSQVCGLMVSRTVWPVLRLSMERKRQNYYYIFFMCIVNYGDFYLATFSYVLEMLDCSPCSAGG